MRRETKKQQNPDMGKIKGKKGRRKSPPVEVKQAEESRKRSKMAQPQKPEMDLLMGEKQNPIASLQNS